METVQEEVWGMMMKQRKHEVPSMKPEEQAADATAADATAADATAADATAADATAADAEVDEVSQLRTQLDEARNAYLRALADSHNTRRRADQEVNSARGRGVASVAHSVLPVLEQIDLMLQHDFTAMQSEQLKAAIEMLKQSMLKALAIHGVTRNEPQPGDAFDPHEHEAVMQMPVAGMAPGHIALCMQAGYRIGDSPLRPAKVAVTPTDA